MPDWFYRTVSRPILFRFSAERARNLALGFMGRLARLPLGPQLIDFLGHMRPDSRLKQTFFGIEFATPVGLGPALDGEAIALPALARFGFGFLEIGPVSLNGNATAKPIERLADGKAIHFPEPVCALSLAEAKERLRKDRLNLPVMVRLTASDDESRAGRLDGLSQLAHLFSIAIESTSLTSIPKLCDKPLLLRLDADAEVAARLRQSNRG